MFPYSGPTDTKQVRQSLAGMKLPVGKLSYNPVSPAHDPAFNK
jgi:hypothetical protein